MADRFGWHGWDKGEDVTPPEPGKRWLTITQHGEELAVIVHRAGQPSDTADMARKERYAQQIVNALNQVYPDF